MTQPETTIYRQVTVQVLNSTGTTVSVGTWTLTDGRWDPNFEPQPGQILDPGATPSFVNFTDQPYTAVGGSLSLAPLSGGMITLSWSWPYGSNLRPSFQASGTRLRVSARVAGATTSVATLEFQLTQ